MVFFVCFCVRGEKIEKDHIIIKILIDYSVSLSKSGVSKNQASKKD